MIEYKLEDIAKVSAGNSAPKKDEFSPDGIPFIRAGSLAFLINGNSINKCERVSEKTAKKKKLKLFNKGSILFAKSGMSAKMGRVYQLEENAYVVSHLAIIAVEDEKANPLFIKYYFNLHPPFYLIRDDAYPSIKLEDIKQIAIKLPDLQTQNKIVAILEKASRLLQKREESIQLLDELLRVQFLEMFGDSWLNPQNWELEKIGSLLAEIKSGWSIGGNQRMIQEGEFGVLKVSSVSTGKFKPSEYKVVPNEKIKKEMIHPLKGDLLFSRANTSELVAATCIVHSDYNNLFLPDKLWKLIPKNEKITSEYLKSVLSNKGFRNKMSKLATGSSGSMQNISKEKLRRIEIPVAPLELQKKYTRIYWKFYESFNKKQEFFFLLEKLFNSLLQRAFNGQLNFIDETALNTLLDAIDVESDTNDLRDITLVYLRQLIEKLNEQDFEDMEQYKKAKHAAFQLLREGKLTQSYQEDSKSVNLQIV